MKPRYSLSTMAATLLLVASQSATAVTISFDEVAANNSNAAITSLYASQGVTFGSDNSGIWGGQSQGDPGNWALEGSNGTAFLGNNGINNGNAYVTSINFSSLMSNVSFDVSRSNGSTAGQSLVASAYQGGTLHSSRSIVLGGINSWTSVAFGIGSITSLIITGSATGFSPYGIDNLQFMRTDNLLSGINQLQGAVTHAPEPTTYFMLLAGLGLLGFMTRGKKLYLAHAPMPAVAT